MRIAITGGTGFVGRNLARRLSSKGHKVVLISRGIDHRDTSIRHLPGATFAPIGTGDVTALESALEGCEVVAHLGGINRELGDQTYSKVHVDGTANVLEAAKKSGVQKVLLLSFLRARPNCGSPYHESKFAAEELVRNSGLDYTIFKAGVIYGAGDHMLDHITHALHTFPIFLLVGLKDQPMRPLAVEDLVDAMIASILGSELSRMTVPVTGPEEINLREAAMRIARLNNKRPIIVPVPLWVHYAMAWVFERIMTVPLEAKAQVRILSESLAEPIGTDGTFPNYLLPRTQFSDDQILRGIPKPEKFGLKDCLHRAKTI